ncbi:MAG: heavy metal translocating P-type ATPase, partial [Gammaproteobacteria bacterium]
MDTPVNNWAAYERPTVMHEFVREQADGTLIADLLIQGVHCAACTWLIENTLKKISGVVAIEVNPVTTRGELQWDPDQINLAALLETIEQTGYLPTPFTEHEHYRASEEERRLALRRLLVAGLGMMQVSSYAVALYAGAFQGMDPVIEEFLRYISLLVATPIVLYSGAPFFSGAWRNIRGRSMGMDVPVALAIGGAWAASVWNTFAGSGEVYFDSATMFVFFLSGTRYLEVAGRRRALELTNALAQHIPCTANRLTARGTEQVGVMELEPGDRVEVLPGIAFPADGILENISTQVDESMLTGESKPVTRKPGEAVVAGTVNLSTTAIMDIEKTGAETVLAQIGRLVTMAGKNKPALVELTDRIAAVFVSVVLTIAMLTALIWWQIDPERAFSVVLTVLVVTCPCALALATPAAFTVATSFLARQGFLVRRAGALQTLAKV